MTSNYKNSASGMTAMVLLISSTVVGAAPSIGIGPSFKGPIGIQLYSLREQFKKDVPGTLDEVKALGIRNVELAGSYNLSPEKFAEELKKRGVKAVSAHYGYDRFEKDVE